MYWSCHPWYYRKQMVFPIVRVAGDLVRDVRTVSDDAQAEHERGSILGGGTSVTICPLTVGSENLVLTPFAHMHEYVQGLMVPSSQG